METILIIGGAGFIGSNAADYFLKQKKKVVIIDNFYRAGSKLNAAWLKGLYGDSVEIVLGDVTKDLKLLGDQVEKSDAILHLAGQTAVTTSVVEPKDDFRMNALGTLNVLEAIRNSSNKPSLIYSSTNKVYGGMDGVKIIRKGERYCYKDYPNGISEEFPLDFHSPYGCSKGSADQYVRDYARIYKLSTIVFRQSCIYGPRQFGVEDQGWVAWFIIASLLNKSIKVYGDGRQVRDILYVGDLVKAYDAAFKKMNEVKGEVFNIGGGTGSTISIWYEFQKYLEKYLGKKIEIEFADWRPGDQKVYISDIRKAKKILNWTPQVSVDKGIEKLCLWIKENRYLFA